MSGSNPFAELEITASSRGLGAKLNEIRGQFKSWAASTAKAAEDPFKRLGSTLGKIAGGAAKGFGFGGAAGLGMRAANGVTDFLEDAAMDSYHFESELTRLQIAAHRTPEAMEALRSSVRAASDETGLSRVSILEGAKAFQAFTGNMDDAEASARAFARAAQASDTPVKEMAELGATLNKTFGVTSAQMESALGVLITEGENGSVELRDMTQLLAGLGPLATRFGGGSGLKGMQDMAATLEALKLATGSGSEAATQYQALMMSLLTHASALKRVGVSVRDQHGEMKSFHDLVVEINKLKLPDEVLKKALGGRGEAFLAVTGLQKFNDAWDDGLAKMEGSAQVVGDHLAAWLDSPAGKIEQSWTELKNKMAEVFTPERIAKFADALGWVVAKSATLIDNIEELGQLMKIWIRDTPGSMQGMANAIAQQDLDTRRALPWLSPQQAKDMQVSRAYQLLGQNSMDEVELWKHGLPSNFDPRHEQIAKARAQAAAGLLAQAGVSTPEDLAAQLAPARLKPMMAQQNLMKSIVGGLAGAGFDRKVLDKLDDMIRLLGGGTDVKVDGEKIATASRKHGPAGRRHPHP